MTVPTSAETTLLNTYPQRTKLYLSIFQPETLFSCRVTGSYNADQQTISYYDASGTASDIGNDLFLVTLVGSAIGDDSKGRTWARSATGTALRFVESDHINWEQDDYVTVLGFTEIIPVFPRIIQDPADEENVIFYKMYDIPYTDQNSILGTFICMGSNYAGFLDPATGQAQVYWTASGTSNVLGDNLTYSWIFEGGTPTGSTSHTPGFVTYDTPGHYRTFLTVTSASNREDKSIRYVSIYDRPGQGSNVPILNWEILQWSGSRDSGGYAVSIRVRENVDKTAIIDGALVVIFGEDWYGDTKQSIGGNAINRQSIKFVGYISGGTIRHNYRDNSVEFDVISPTGIMQESECFSVSVESKNSPSTWFELKDMTISRAIYHYLAWHSTVLLCCDFEYTDDDRNIQYFDADRTSIYDAINELMSGARFGKIVSDKQGKLWAEQDASVIDNASTALSTTLSVTKRDWIDEPVIDEKFIDETSFIEMGGISYDPGLNTFGAFLASAPSVAPKYRGTVERIQGIALEDQDELNTMVGNLLAWENARFPNVEMRLRANFGNLDIAPQEIIKITTTSEDTARGIVFTDKAFVIQSIDWTYNSIAQALLPRVTLHEVTQGFAGATIVIPDVPPDSTEDDGGGSFGIPPITIPPIPTFGLGIDIYHNGLFVCRAQSLNFIDDGCTGTV